VSGDQLRELRRLIREEVRAARTAELGVVQAQHPHASDGDSDNYAVTVRLRDTGIVLGKVPVATGRLGSVAIPPAGALVLVQFIGGDVNAPVVTGTFYNDEERPPVSADGQVIWNLPADAGPDDALRLEVSSADRKSIVLKLASAVTVELKDDDPAVSIDVGGNAQVTIDSDGTVTITSAQSLAVKAGRDLKVEAQGNMELKASGTLTLKGSVINLN
jgi:adhesin HecA-like repeat protein